MPGRSLKTGVRSVYVVQRGGCLDAWYVRRGIIIILRGMSDSYIAWDTGGGGAAGGRRKLLATFVNMHAKLGQRNLVRK